METSIRQMLALGTSKAALEIAKDFYKAQRTAAAESLLLDVYAARIQSLLDQNLTLEAKSLLDLVRQRFPAAKERLDGALRSVAAHSGDLGQLLQPLMDAGLSAERRAAIEKVIQTELTDLGALAACDALPAEHPLRQAAGALARAFELVTSGPVSDEQIALGEVSFRSPLASWKFLIRAIASLYRGEDERCKECVAAIKPDSVAARLIPALQWMLGSKTGGTLKTAEAALVSSVDLNLSDLRVALQNLEAAFSDYYREKSKVLKAARAVVRECRQTAPALLPELKQVILVRWLAGQDDEEQMAEALEGTPVKNAEYLRMFALAMEASEEDEGPMEACALWDQFLKKAVQEGWFSEGGVEAGAVYLHMAEILEKLEPAELIDLEERALSKGDELYFWSPTKLFERACAADPHAEAFQAWMRYAEEDSDDEAAEKVARRWHQQCPDALEPVLYLMEEAEDCEEFPAALGLLEEAARIDPVHVKVRAARARLLTGAIAGYLREKKTLLAEAELKALEELPQMRQGDRPAMVAALRCLLLERTGDSAGMRQARLEAERLLGLVGGGLLIYGLAACTGRSGPLMLRLPPVKLLTKTERTSVPVALARVMALVRELGVDNNMEFPVPEPYLKEATAQFPKVKEELDGAQLHAAGEMGLSLDLPKLAWMAAGEGLKRGGDLTARFLMLRASATPAHQAQRSLALLAAAIEFGRLQGDRDLVDEAVELARNPYGGESAHMTLEQAREVVRRELRLEAFPTAKSRPPNYDDLLPMAKQICDCADCRRKRGEDLDDGGELLPFGDDSFEPGFNERMMREMFDEMVPKGMPSELKKQLFEMMKESFLTGESAEEIMERTFGPPPGGKKKKR